MNLIEKGCNDWRFVDAMMSRFFNTFDVFKCNQLSHILETLTRCDPSQSMWPASLMEMNLEATTAPMMDTMTRTMTKM